MLLKSSDDINAKNIVIPPPPLQKKTKDRKENTIFFPTFRFPDSLKASKNLLSTVIDTEESLNDNS